MVERNDWTREELERDYVNAMTAITVQVNIRVEGGIGFWIFLKWREFSDR